jgi:hypothetical protein
MLLQQSGLAVATDDSTHSAGDALLQTEAAAPDHFEDRESFPWRTWVADVAESFSGFDLSATQAAAQLSEHIAERSVALREVAARLAEQHASLRDSAGNAFAHLAEQSSLCATCAVKAMDQIAAQLSEQQTAFMLAARQTAFQFAEREARIKQSAADAAAQLTERMTRLPESSAALKVAAERLREQQEIIQNTARQALAQLADWQLQFKSAASQKVAEWGVTEGQAVSQIALRRAVEAVGTHLSERQAALAQAASAAAAQLTRSAAANRAAELLYEHEMLLRQSSTLIVGLADMQATISPSARRIAAQLAELAELNKQNHHQDHATERHSSMAALREVQDSRRFSNNTTASTKPSTMPPEPKAFAYAWVLAVKRGVQRNGLELLIAAMLCNVVGMCLCNSITTIRDRGGEDAACLGFDRLLMRAGCWFVHRVCLGWALLLLSDILERPPYHIRRYDAMGWPLWSTLLPLSSQIFFFIPAAAILNAAVGYRSKALYSTPARRRFYASLSREVHASIIGCFVSDWCLFPTDVIFLTHHLLGLGIIFGVWSMVLKEAKSIELKSTTHRTEISFWWITGLSIATMEGSSFFYCLYSLISFGNVLNLSLFAVFTYANVLAILCVIARHPWSTSMNLIWNVGEQLGEAIEDANAACQTRLSTSRTKAYASLSYMWKACMVAAISLARQSQMWADMREQVSKPTAVLLSTICVVLAAGCVWRLRDFDAKLESM